MESIQQQISALTQKVDRIYQIVDRLHQHVSDNVEDRMVGGEETSIRHSRRYTNEFPAQSEEIHRLRQNGNSYRNSGYANLPGGANYYHDSPEWVITQQDVLIDSSGVEISHHQIKEQDLSPQVQIQRLTAQLTAAYNRIAALEEQLLAKRWK